MIEAINSEDWNDIVALESNAYLEVEPESQETLKTKWNHSPQYCFVYKMDGIVVSYLLAHTWNSKVPPKLFEPLVDKTKGDFLFIHDLVVAKKLTGKGVGRMMAEHVLHLSDANGIENSFLVAIQNSSPFWSKFNFRVSADQV